MAEETTRQESVRDDGGQQSGSQRVFTQEEVNAFVAERSRHARSAALKDKAHAVRVSTRFSRLPRGVVLSAAYTNSKN